MSLIDEATDETLESMESKIDMLAGMLEISKAETEICLELMGDNRPDFDTLKQLAKERVKDSVKPAVIDQRPPRIEPTED